MLTASPQVNAGHRTASSTFSLPDPHPISISEKDNPKRQISGHLSALLLSLQSISNYPVLRCIPMHSPGWVHPWPSVKPRASWAAKQVTWGSLSTHILIPRIQPECQWPKSHYQLSASLITMSFSFLLVFRKISFPLSGETTLLYTREFTRHWYLLLLQT